MKITFFLIVFLVFLGFQSQAQNNSVGDEFLFGVKAGINSSSVYATEGEGFSPEGKAGFAAGIFLSIPLIDFIGIQPEVMISQKGFNAKGSLIGNEYEFTRNTTYIDVPLLVALKPVSFLTLLAGPHYSYLLKEKYSFENASTTIDLERDLMNSDTRKSTLGFGGGLDINLNHFVIGARAFLDLQKNNADQSATTPRYKNVWYQGTIGYRLY